MSASGGRPGTVRQLRPLWPLFLVTLLVAPWPASASGYSLGEAAPSRAVGGVSTVFINATDALAFVASASSVPSLTVNFVIEDLGTVAHTFTLSSRVNQTAPSSTSTSSAPGSYFAWPDLLTDQSLNASQTLHLTIDFPVPGSYQYICRIHFPAMQGTLTVGRSPGSSSLGGSLLMTLEWVVLGAGAVLVLAAVALILVSRRGGKSKPKGAPPRQPTGDRTGSHV